MNDSTSTLDNVSLSELLMVNVCTCFLMVFLIWYADNIIPWGPGIHKPPWFPFLFYRNFLLQHINLKIYRHQITVLTGPAGSGKSTMIKMITGLVPPSSGQIIVDNYDVVLHTEEARERIAYCPADNVLFDELTVEEHLIFFAMLKGLAMSKIRQEINLLLTDIQMSAYMSYRPSTLSDGMKRLLGVAATLLVASKCKILIFDEPTVTMDPHSQREVWELLLKARRHSCILLTTQNLHEADVLGDKVGIMNKGLLWCSGSPGFLRERFRAGYNIRVVKEPGCDTAAIESLFQRHVPHAVVKNDSNAEAEFAMGANPGNRKLTAMFKELDRERHNLKIGAMSVAMSSLEEVLDKVTHDPTFQSGIEAGTPVNTENELVYKATKDPGRGAPVRQLAWLIKKRFYIWLRDWHPPFVRWVVPMCVLLLATHLQRMYSEEDIVSSDFYKDRLQYTIRALRVPSPLGFVSANRSRGDPVLHHMRKLFAEEDIRPLYIASDHTSSRLLDYADDYPRTYNYRLLFGVVFIANTTPTLWYNGQCPHAAPLLVNLYHSALLRNITGRPAARFVLINQPYSNETGRRRGRADEKQDLQLLLQSKLIFIGTPLNADALLVEVLMGIFMPLALCFHAASFVVFPIMELCSEFKHLQLMTGVSGLVYWLSNFVFDTVLAAACAFIFVPTICFSHRYLKKPAYTAVLSMLFLAHGLSMVPFCYVVSTHFKDSSFGFSVMVIVIFFTGLVGALETVIVHFTLTVAEARVLSLVPWALEMLFRVVPTFTLTRGIAQLHRLRRENDICEAGDEQLASACRTVDLSHTISLKYCCNALPSRNSNGSAGVVAGSRHAMIEPNELSCAVMIEVYVMLVEAVVFLAFVAFMDATPYARLRRRMLAKVQRARRA
ncbi:hypothetical protein HPB50_023656 [Hyalomma asiaticum]|uniref:Uncharacterized protein n=1 Tax=Hyalomma asiaticum TaxID=266040 RepID=A0ACB7T4Q1_HYAAI|nr:hypothetical protein HPB50_023656 [Hyalomma asiaticum]